MHFFYSFLLTLLLLVSWPYWLWRYFSTPKYRGTLAERWGWLPRSLIFARRPIWFHAVSVGEVMAAQGLVEAVRRRFPDRPILLSTVTKTGQQVARERLPGLEGYFYLPLDFVWVTRRVVRQLHPCALVVMETELWPNLFRALGEADIPIMIANGRLSARSFRRYHRVRWLMAIFLRPVTLFAMQSEEDGQRIRALCPWPERVRVTGNLKYEQARRLPDSAQMDELNARLGAQSGLLWIAASTHPGEEEIIVAVHRRLLVEFPDLRLILVPRHPERCSAVAAWLLTVDCSFRLFSAARGGWSESILLVDEMGWLTRLYGVVQAAFVGGSLIPHGGQNPLEPAAWGVVPLLGPHTFNFREPVARLLAAQAAVQVADGEALTAILRLLLRQEEQRREMGQRAQEIVAAPTQALTTTSETIAAILDGHCHEQG